MAVKLFKGFSITAYKAAKNEISEIVYLAHEKEMYISRIRKFDSVNMPDVFEFASCDSIPEEAKFIGNYKFDFGTK